MQALSQQHRRLQGQSPRGFPVIVAAASWAGQKDCSQASNGPVPKEKMPATPASRNVTFVTSLSFSFSVKDRVLQLVVVAVAGKLQVSDEFINRWLIGFIV